MIEKMTGKVEALYISTKEKKREQRNELILNELGIIDDKFFDKDINRSVLIASIDSYKTAKKHDIEIEYGFLGENILLDVNPYSLKLGDSIVIGNAILEITQNCTICNSFSKVNKKLPEILKDERGIFAKTIKSGNIKIGDFVKLIEN